MKKSTRLFPGLAGVLCLNLLLPCPSVQAGDLAVDNLTVGAATTGGNATGVLPTEGARYVIVEQLQGDTDVQRGQKLLAAYAKAITMSPSINNRITVFVPPGDYDLGSSGIILSQSYVDMVGLVPARMTTRAASSVVTDGVTDVMDKQVALNPSDCGLRLYGTGQGVIQQTAPHVRIANMIVENVRTSTTFNRSSSDPASYWPDSGLDDVVVEHVRFVGAKAYAMRVCIEYRGTFSDCVSDDFGFGSNCNSGSGSEGGVASGHFENCVGGNCSFGGSDYATGTFVNCSGGNNSFGWFATGSFDHCFGGYVSFGGSDEGEAIGSFKYCVGGFNSFGGLAAGYFERCIGGSSSFGSSSGFPNGFIPNLVLIHCKASGGSFGELAMSSQDFNYNANTSDFAGNLDLHNGSITNGVYYGDGSSLHVSPQGDLSMGTFTAGPP